MTDAMDDLQMVTCEECGKEVPESNMTMHRLCACSGRARAPNSDSNSESRQEDNDHDNGKNENDVVDLITPTATASRKRDKAPISTPPRRRQKGRLKRDADYDTDVEPMDVDSDDEVEVLESTTTATTNNSKKKEDDSVEVVDQDVVEILDDDDDDEWACKRCTLLNDKHVTMCVMCGTKRDGASQNTAAPRTPDGVRPPDPVRRERLIGGDSPLSNGSPLAAVGGGALLGGLVGAGAAYMRGQSMSRGAFDGSMAGAVSGAFLNEYMRSPDQTTTSPTSSSSRRRTSFADTSSYPELWTNMSGARSATVTGQPSYPSITTRSNRRSTRQPRSSFRMTEVLQPDGSRRVMVQESSRAGAIRYTRQSQSLTNDPIMNFLLASRSTLGGAAMGGVDGMSYDQLLAQFGDGTENLGASIQLISSLPTAKVKTKPDGTIDLPEEACQCAVCLEDFEEGQIRKTLPCLHGFHATCVDKWLQTNSCCPVCKFRVEENGRPS